MPNQEKRERPKFQKAMVLRHPQLSLFFMYRCPRTIKIPYSATAIMGTFGCAFIQLRAGIGSYFFSHLKRAKRAQERERVC
jgi:hypothetical protein